MRYDSTCESFGIDFFATVLSLMLFQALFLVVMGISASVSEIIWISRGWVVYWRFLKEQRAVDLYGNQQTILAVIFGYGDGKEKAGAMYPGYARFPDCLPLPIPRVSPCLLVLPYPPLYR